jgi:hypothetical protein
VAEHSVEFAGGEIIVDQEIGAGLIVTITADADSDRAWSNITRGRQERRQSTSRPGVSTDDDVDVDEA